MLNITTIIIIITSDHNNMSELKSESVQVDIII